MFFKFFGFLFGVQLSEIFLIILHAGDRVKFMGSSGSLYPTTSPQRYDTE